MVDIHTS